MKFWVMLLPFFSDTVIFHFMIDRFEINPLLFADDTALMVTQSTSCVESVDGEGVW